MGPRKLLVASIGVGTVSYVAAATSCGGHIKTGSSSSMIDSGDDSGDDGSCYVCFSSSGIVGNLMLGPVMPVVSCCAVTKAFAPPGTPVFPLVTGDAGSSSLRALTSGTCTGSDGGLLIDCRWTLAPGAAGTLSATTIDRAGNFVATYSCGATPSADTANLDCISAPPEDAAACPLATHLSTTVTCVSPPCGLDAGACDQ